MLREDARQTQQALRIAASVGVAQTYIDRLEEPAREVTPEDVHQARLALMEEALARLAADKE